MKTGQYHKVVVLNAWLVTGILMIMMKDNLQIIIA